MFPIDKIGIKLLNTLGKSLCCILKYNSQNHLLLIIRDSFEQAQNVLWESTTYNNTSNSFPGVQFIWVPALYG